MTTPIVDLKCPACGHLVGQQEYERIRANFDRRVELKSNEEIEQIRCQCDKKVQDMKDQHERNIDNEVNQRVASLTKENQSKYDEENMEKERRHQAELALKDKEIREAKLQNAIDIEEKIKQAINSNEEKLEAKYRQKETERELHLLQIKEENRNLLNRVEKLQKIVDSAGIRRCFKAGVSYWGCCTSSLALLFLFCYCRDANAVIAFCLVATIGKCYVYGSYSCGACY